MTHGPLGSPFTDIRRHHEDGAIGCQSGSLHPRLPRIAPTVQALRNRAGGSFGRRARSAIYGSFTTRGGIG